MSKLQAPPLTLLEKYRGDEFQPLYTASVTVRGGEADHGRASGIARSDDGALQVDLRLPAELGGPWAAAATPEQLKLRLAMPPVSTARSACLPPARASRYPRPRSRRP